MWSNIQWVNSFLNHSEILEEILMLKLIMQLLQQSNYATKANVKNISHADTSSLAVKSNLASLKTGRK